MSLYKQKIFLKYEFKNIILKSIIKNNNINNCYRYLSFYKKNKITKISIISQQRNRCVISGRTYGIIKKGNYSRFVFRINSYNGDIPGFKRASW